VICLPGAWGDLSIASGLGSEAHLAGGCVKCDLLLDAGWGVGIACEIFTVTSLSKLSAPFLSKRLSTAFCKRSRSQRIALPAASMWGGSFFGELLLMGMVKSAKPTINQMDYRTPRTAKRRSADDTARCSANKRFGWLTNACSMMLIKMRVPGVCCWSNAVDTKKSLANKCATTKESCNLKKGEHY
jgi:hypothetical protein